MFSICNGLFSRNNIFGFGILTAAAGLFSWFVVKNTDATVFFAVTSFVLFVVSHLRIAADQNETSVFDRINDAERMNADRLDSVEDRVDRRIDSIYDNITRVEDQVNDLAPKRK
jgi:hypothetical protein